MSCLNTQQQSRPSFDLTRFWQEEIANTQSLEANFKTHPLPLARIKKVMKTDPEVKMISAEAPILFAKACEVFITELTKRAWVHAEESKRRTLLRSDIAMGISKTDMCDFLIDIVPRTEAVAAETSKQSATANEAFTYRPESDQFDAEASASSEKPAAYYPDLSQVTPEQLEQYQLQLQHFVAHLSRNQQREPIPDESSSSKTTS